MLCYDMTTNNEHTIQHMLINISIASFNDSNSNSMIMIIVIMIIISSSGGGGSSSSSR